MSATQSSSGPEAEKSRSTRSGAGADAAAFFVVLPLRRRLTPSISAARMSRATRFTLTARPRAPNSAWTRSAPYVPPLMAWISRISALSAAFARARSDGSRFRHA